MQHSLLIGCGSFWLQHNLFRNEESCVLAVSRLSSFSSSTPVIQLSPSWNSRPIRVSCEMLSVCQQLKAFQNSPRTDSVNVLCVCQCVCACACILGSSAFSRLNYLTFLSNKKARKGKQKRGEKRLTHVHKSQRYTEECAHTHTHKRQCQTKPLIWHQCLVSNWTDKARYAAAGSALHWVRSLYDQPDKQCQITSEPL